MVDNRQLSLISVIIPSYNHDKYIEECLLQIIELDLDKEIIIIDDGSTDNTVQVVKDFINTHQNDQINLIEKEVNSGLVSSLNLGLEISKSKYIYFIASDDIPNSYGLKQAIHHLEQNEGLDFFIGGGRNFFKNKNKSNIYSSKHDDFFSLPFEKRSKDIFLNYPSPLLLQSIVFKTNILRKIGGWDKSIILDDYPIFVKLLTDRYIKFMFMPFTEIVLYRHHGYNTYRDLQKQFMMVRQALDKLAPNELKDKAIGNALGYYLLKSLYQFNLKLSWNLFFEVSRNAKVFALLKILKIIKNKIWNL